MATITVLASSYTGSTFTGGVTSEANAYTNTSSTNYATFTTPTRTTGTYEVYLTGYDFSSIPSGATINSVTIKVKAMVTSTSYISSADVQAYAGTTTKGSQTSYRTTTATTYTLSSGSWTRAELNTMRIKFNAYRSNNKNNTAAIRIYGIEVTVDYTVPAGSEVFMYKVNGNWKTVSKIYKKVNNAWAEQTDLKNLFDTTANYMKGD